MQTAVIVLAAGKGTRMKSDLPKVLHRVAGAPLLVHAMRAGQGIAAERTIVVVGDGADQVERAAHAWNEEAVCVEQREQLGTGHAVRQASAALAGFDGDVIVLYGDTPFVAPATLERMLAARRGGHAVVVLGFEAATPGFYGRLITGEDGALEAIVEAREATPEQLAVTLCNSGVICAGAGLLFSLLDEVRNDNTRGEYYLTDIVALARGRGLTCSAVTCPEAETLGVNSRADLAAAEAAFQARARRQAMEAGVTLVAPETVFLSHDTQLGRDVVVEPNVIFGPEVTVEGGATIRAFSYLEGCHVAQGAIVGPYARLRPGAEIGTGAHVGNFVEIKAASIGDGAKVNHLSYIGDASVGTRTNIGAGTITCNYDGVSKHRTEIGAGAFIGSNSALVAPVSVGDGALVAAGSVVTMPVPADALAVARARQVVKPKLAAAMFARLRAQRTKG